MPEFEIRYKIEDNVDPEEVKEWYHIGGAICARYKDVILTKTDIKDDDGYLGNWIFDEVMGLINQIPRLILGVKCELIDEEDYIVLSMEPKNGLIFFSVIPKNMDGTIDKELLSHYPCGLDGCPIPARLFLNGVYEMGCRFIDDVTSRYKNLRGSEVDFFKIKLKLARDALDEYNKTH